MIGTTLSHFEITAKLGEGGMGEVYRARDTKLGREVAIKVLPKGFTEDSERLARFEREAQVLASLNHTNIAAIYDFDHAGGIYFLAMELVEGSTLDEVLERGAIAIEDAVPLARQIAAALEAAHEQGIVHRDLKPANIKITPDRRVKVLDFGLAKAWQAPAGNSGSLSMSPTLTAQMTQAGVILGTAAYMSPEQAKGLEADRRSDIWSFGVVLWEMLAGRRLFRGDSVSDTLAGVLRDEIDGSPLPAETPATLRALIARSLERDPRKRLRDIGEARIALDSLESDAGGSTLLGAAPPPSGEASPRSSRARLPWVITGLACVAVAVLAWLYASAPVVEMPRLIHSSLLTPDELITDYGSGFVLSPDGSRLAFVSSSLDEGGRIWIRELASGAVRPLADTQDGSYPFWSPDGGSIAFFSGGSLRRITVDRGSSQTLAAAPDGRGGSWNADGLIVFAPSYGSSLYSIDDGGGEPEPITEIDTERGEKSHRFPVFLPDGRRVLFLSQTGEGDSPRDDSRIELLDLETGDRTPVLEANSSVVFSPSGHLLFWREGSLYAQPFDTESGTVAGKAVPIAEEIAYTGNEFGAFSAAKGGLLAYEQGRGFGRPSRLIVVDRQGRAIGEPSSLGIFRNFSLSHSGRRAAFQSERNIWIRDLERGTNIRMTFEEGDIRRPIWSPDDQWILYRTYVNRRFLVMRRPASGRGSGEVVAERAAQISPWDWSPDGMSVLVVVDGPETGMDIAILDLETGEVETLVATRAEENSPHFSPDGKWIAYQSDETGFWGIYVIAFDGSGSKYQAVSGGVHPMWSADGSRIFYFGTPSNSQRMVSELAVEYREGLEFGRPVPLFDLVHALSPRAPFAVMPDGKSFLVNSFSDEAKERPLTLIQNWTRLLDGR